MDLQGICKMHKCVNAAMICASYLLLTRTNYPQCNDPRQSSQLLEGMAAKKLEKDNRPILSSNVNCESCSEEASTGDSVSAAVVTLGHTRYFVVWTSLTQ